MSLALVTGSSGLVGAACVSFLIEKGFRVLGVDNDMRRYFFGEGASTHWATEKLLRKHKEFEHHDLDIRDEEGVNKLFAKYGKGIDLIVHAAAQPSHDWAAKEPITDFSINATGTLVLLEALRNHCPETVFIHCSTNKVYGDTPNQLPLVEQEDRWEVDPSHPYAEHGIDEKMSIDESTHSLFGVSKAAGDLLAQEYGRYFDLKTGIFRGGCLTGPGHSGAELHGFLSYLMQSALHETPYSIFGYKGKQVRDNIHCYDLANAFFHFFENPRPGEVYNIGGSRHSNCSMKEAITLCEEISGKKLNVTYKESNRIGDHIWYISDVRKFQEHYPNWEYRYSLKDILVQIHDELLERPQK